MVRPDILVRGAGGDERVFVEVKARRNVDREWAAALRRNLLSHGARVAPQFFMIVTADDAYLWRETGAASSEPRSPDAQISLLELLGVDNAAMGTADGEALELIVSSWLSALTQAAPPSVMTEPAQTFLVQSGLLDALRGSSVAFEPA